MTEDRGEVGGGLGGLEGETGLWVLLFRCGFFVCSIFVELAHASIVCLRLSSFSCGVC